MRADTRIVEQPDPGAVTRPRRRRDRRGLLAVAGASAVLAGCLAAGPLFLSSAATAATRRDVAERCPSLVNAHYTGLYSNRDRAVAALGAAGGAVPFAAAPRLTDVSPPLPLTLPHDDGVFRSAVVVHRTAGTAHLEYAAHDRDRGVSVPDWFAAEEHLHLRDRLRLRASDGTTVPVPVIGIYRDVVASRVASYWCGIGSSFEPNRFGDHKPPVLILDDSGAERYASLFALGRTTWELPLAGRPTASADAAYRAHLDAVRGAGERLGERFFAGAQLGYVDTDLDFVVPRTRAITSFTQAGIAPVRGAAAIAGFVLVLAAAVMFVRRNRREYRIRVLRGTHPLVLAGEEARAGAPPAVAGAVVGVFVTAALIRTFGPSTDLDRASLVSALWFTAFAVLFTVAVVAVTVAVMTRRLERVRARPRGWWRRVPFELAGVVLAMFAFGRLRDAGAVTLTGSTTSHIDPLAVLFPLLLIAGLLVALVRPMATVLGRMGTTGARARPSVMLGVRRAVGDPTVTTLTSAAIAFCIATFAYASTMSANLEASIGAKASTAAGADLRVGMTSAPRLDAALAPHATVVTRGPATLNGAPVTVLGVDTTTFRRVAYWQRSYASASLPTLLASLHDAGDRLPVIVAGADVGLTPATLQFAQGQSAATRVVGRAALWPSMQHGDTFVIADRAALARRGFDGQTELWLRGPNLPAPSRLAQPHAGVIYSVDRAGVLDFNNTLPVRWSLGLLRALGILVGLAFAAVEVVLIDSRARTRRLAYLFWTRMGMSDGQHRVACALELAIPAALGAVVAVGVAIVAVRLAIEHADSLPFLPPPTVFALTARPWVVCGLVLVAVLAALAERSHRITRASDPMELTRVAE